jgi:hypothetical protein
MNTEAVDTIGKWLIQLIKIQGKRNKKEKFLATICPICMAGKTGW